MRRMIALTVALGLMAPDAALALPVSAVKAADRGDSSQSVSALPLRLNLPVSAGWIDAAYSAPTSGGIPAPLIVLLQDAHTNASAQFNAARVIDLVLESAGTDLVLMEAGQGDIGLEAFLSYGTPRTRAGAAAPLVRKGLLQGAEYLQLSSSKKIRLQGVENRAAYERALDRYREVVRRRPAALTAIARMERTLRILGPEAFGPAVIEAWQKRNAYRDGSVGAVEYAEYLLEMQTPGGQNDVLYPNLKTLSKLKAKESQIDFAAASAALTKLLHEEGVMAEEEAAAAPMKMAHNIVPDALSARAAEALTAGGSGLSPEELGDLNSYLEYRRVCRSLDVAELGAETSRAEAELMRRLTADDEDASRWAWCAEQLERLRALVMLEITSGQEGIGRQAPQHEASRQIAAILNRRILDLGRFEEAVIFDDAELNQTVRLAEDFYDLAAVRDEFFVGRALRSMKQRGGKAAVLVAGGYHAPHLRRMLRDKGISYVSIIPRVEHETDHSRYERLLTASATIALYTAGSRSAASREAQRALGEAMRGLPNAARLAQSASGQESRQPSQPEYERRTFWSELGAILLNRLRFERAIVRHRFGRIGLPELLDHSYEYHLNSGFLKPDAPGAGPLIQMGGYLYSLLDLRAKKAGATGFAGNTPLQKRLSHLKTQWRKRTLGFRKAVAWVKGEHHQDNCRLCRLNLPPTQRPFRYGRSWISPNPFPYFETKYKHFVVHLGEHRALREPEIGMRPNARAEAGADLEEALRTAHTMHRPSQDRPWTVLINHRDVGASIKEHHHFHLINIELPVFNRSQFELENIQPESGTNAGVSRLKRYPSRPVILHSNDLHKVSLTAMAFAREFEENGIPAAFAIQWSPERGYEAAVLAYRAKEQRAHEIGTPQAAGAAILVRHSDQPKDWAGAPANEGAEVQPWEMETPTSEEELETIIRTRVLLDAEGVDSIVERVLGQLTHSDPSKIDPNNAQDPAGARMADVLADAALKKLIENTAAPVIAPDSTQAASEAVLGAWAAKVKEAYRDYRDTLWANREWTDDQAQSVISAKYSEGVRHIVRVMAEAALQHAAIGASGEETRLLQNNTALAVTGSVALAEMRLASDVDVFWIFPEEAVIEGGDEESLTLRPAFSQLQQFYADMHRKVFGSASPPSVGHQLKSEQRQVVEAFASRVELKDDGEHARMQALSERIGKMMDAQFVAGSPKAFDAIRKEFYNQVDQSPSGGVEDSNARGMIRQMILLRDMEYRKKYKSLTGTSLIKRGIGGIAEWRLHRYLLQLADRRVAKQPLSSRIRHWYRLWKKKDAPVQRAAWRLAALRDQQSDANFFDNLTDAARVQYLKDATLVFESNAVLMESLWDSVRYKYQVKPADSDSLSLEVFVAADPDRGSVIKQSDIKSLLRRSQYDAEVWLAPEEIVPGVSELAVAWPQDRTGLLEEASAMLAARRGINLIDARVITRNGRTLDVLRVRGLPEDPAERTRVVLQMKSDLRDLYARRLQVEDIFDREGRPYRWTRTITAFSGKPFKTTTWVDGDRIGLFTQNMTEPGIFHIITRWLAKREVSIVSSGRIWTQGDLVSDDFVIRHASGGVMTEDEMQTLAADLAIFLDQPEISAGSFYPSLDTAYHRLNDTLASQGDEQSLEETAENYHAAWRQFEKEIWGDDPQREAVSALDDFEARTKLYAEGARRITAALWARVPKKMKKGWTFYPTGLTGEDVLTPWQDGYWALMPVSSRGAAQPAPAGMITAVEAVFRRADGILTEEEFKRRHDDSLGTFLSAATTFLNALSPAPADGPQSLDSVNRLIRDPQLLEKIRTFSGSAANPWNAVSPARQRLIEDAFAALNQDPSASEARTIAFNRKLMWALYPQDFPGGPEGESWIMVADPAAEELERLEQSNPDWAWNPALAHTFGKRGADTLDTVKRFFMLMNAGVRGEDNSRSDYQGALARGLRQSPTLMTKVREDLQWQWKGFHETKSRDFAVNWNWVHGHVYRPQMWIELMDWIRRVEWMYERPPTSLASPLRTMLLMSHRANLLDLSTNHRFGPSVEYGLLPRIYDQVKPTPELIRRAEVHPSRNPTDGAEDWFFGPLANGPRVEAYLTAAQVAVDLLAAPAPQGSANEDLHSAAASALGLSVTQGAPILTDDNGPVLIGSDPVLDLSLQMSNAQRFELWSKEPERVAQIFELSALSGYPLSMDLERQIREWRQTAPADLIASLSDPLSSGYEGMRKFRQTFDAMMDLEVPVYGAVVAMHRTGVLQALIPEAGEVDLAANLNRFHSHRVLWHSIRVLKGVESTAAEFEEPASTVWKPGLRKSLRYAALLHDLPKPMTRFSIDSDEDSIAAYRIIPAVMRRFGHAPDGLVEALAAWLTIHDLHLAKNAKQVSGREPSEIAHALLRPWWVSQGTDARIAALVRAALRRGGYGAAEAFAALMVFAWADEDSIQTESKFNNMPPNTRSALTGFWRELKGRESSGAAHGGDAVEEWVQESLELKRQDIRHDYLRDSEFREDEFEDPMQIADFYKALQQIGIELPEASAEISAANMIGNINTAMLRKPFRDSLLAYSKKGLFNGFLRRKLRALISTLPEPTSSDMVSVRSINRRILEAIPELGCPKRASDAMDAFLHVDPSIWTVLNKASYLKLRNIFRALVPRRSLAPRWSRAAMLIKLRQIIGGSAQEIPQAKPEIGWIVERAGRYMDVIAVSSDSVSSLAKKMSGIIYQTGGSIQDGQMTELRTSEGNLAYLHMRVVWAENEGGSNEAQAPGVNKTIAAAIRDKDPKAIADALSEISSQADFDADSSWELPVDSGSAPGLLQVTTDLFSVAQNPNEQSGKPDVLVVTVETGDIRGIFGGL
ncbi:MAG: hypothetical protein KBD07_02115, partial [Candidatus Omnitrophica bacterium]|nr:hypothetical protein [Candidatus Omnitrophota bacterium]